MHRQQRQRSVLEQDMGILCYGDKGNVTVAQLMFSESDVINKYEGLGKLCLKLRVPILGLIDML